MRSTAATLVIGLSLLGAGIGCGESDAAVDTDTDGGGASSGSTAATATDPMTDPGTTTDASTSTDPGSSSDPTTPGSSTSGDSSSTGDPAACPATAVEPGEYVGLELDFEGRTRNYTMFVPSSYDGTAATPLVFNFHGFSSNASQQIFFSDFNVDAEERGVIAIYPNGVLNSWNAGACCGTAASEDVDDVGFVRALLDEVAQTLCIDRDRVYATGMSNGGFMSHRLACEGADFITAIGPVAGPLGLRPKDCQPSRPVPVIHFHGTADTVVPYGGNGGDFPPVEESLQGWADRNGCDTESTVTFEMNDASCQTWDGCDDDASVTLCSLAGSGHCWPGQVFCPTGLSTLTIRANAMMLDLFEQHSLQ